MIEYPTLFTLVVLIIGFYMAWNIGANDVSNAMGTSVGSGALTLRRAVILAAILEFCGAYFVGSNVSETLQRGIVNPEIFISQPMVLVLGMCGALLGTSFWLQLASYLGWPVSTTHAIVGAILGFGLLQGIDAIEWSEIISIVISWIISPIISSIIAYLCFSFVQRKILYAMDPIAATRRATPLFLFIFFTTFTLSLISNGLQNLDLCVTFSEAMILAIFVGLVSSLIGYFILKKIKVPKLSPQSAYSYVEKNFVFFQILSACFVAFAHGANDVANAIGPVAAVIDVLNKGAISATAPIAPWLLALGGVGIVIGLSTWGWRVIETIGKKITELTPTRGFCAEFGAATTILIASKLGLPISTTHCLVGAVLGVGLARGLSALNLGMIREIVLSWIVTIPASAGISIACFYILKWIIL